MTLFDWIIDQFPSKEEASRVAYGVELKERGLTVCQCPVEYVEFLKDEEIFIIRPFKDKMRFSFIRASRLEGARVFSLKEGHRFGPGSFRRPRPETDKDSK